MNSIRLSARNRVRVSLVLTTISLLLTSYSLLHAKLVIDDLGIVGSFPVSFWIGLVLLTLGHTFSWSSAARHWLPPLQLFLLILELMLFPLILGASYPGFDHVLRDAGYWGYIASEAHINPAIVSYHYWPATGFILAFALQILGLKEAPTAFLTTTSLWAQLLSALPLYLILRSAFSPEHRHYVWWALWLFVLSNWSASTRFSPAWVAYLLVLFFIVLVFKGFSRNLGSSALNLSCLLLLATLTTTHLLNSLLGLVISTTLLVLGRKKPISPTLVVTMAVFIVSWMFYRTYVLTQSYLPYYWDNFLDIFTVGLSIEQRVTGAGPHSMVARTKLLLTAGSILLAGLGWFSSRKFQHAKDTGDKWMPALCVAVIGLIILIGSTYGYGTSYGAASLIDYLVPLSSLSLVYFGTKLLSFKIGRVFLCIFILLALPLYFISYYGNETVDYISPANLKGLYFFHNIVDSGKIYGNLPVGQMIHPERYKVIELFFVYSDLKQGTLSQTKLCPASGETSYFVLSRRDRSWFRWILEDPQSLDDIYRLFVDGSKYNFVYSNLDTEVYVKEG